MIDCWLFLCSAYNFHSTFSFLHRLLLLFLPDSSFPLSDVDLIVDPFLFSACLDIPVQMLKVLESHMNKLAEDTDRGANYNEEVIRGAERVCVYACLLSLMCTVNTFHVPSP